MDVELLVVPDCPNEVSAYDLALAALAELDIVASVSTTVIESNEQAQARGFTGSPTFLINGHDPFAEPGATAGVACRVYRTPRGTTPRGPSLTTSHLAAGRSRLRRRATHNPHRRQM
jgi:hypothetical protein